MLKTKPQRRPRAFTLVELLVVIGIIGVLIALALPALSAALRSSRRTACLSNLKQTGVGFAAYQDEHKDMLPVVQTLPVDPARDSIMDAMQDYLPEGESWRCPSDTGTFARLGTSYEYFLGLILGLLPESDARAIARDRSASAVVLTDAEGWHPGGPDGLDRNALYGDAHVDWLEAETIQPTNDGSE